MERNDNLEFLEFVDIVEEAIIVDNERANIPKRYIRDVENPLQFYDDFNFRNRYRFSKNIFNYVILPLIAPRLFKINNRGLPISPVIQILLALRYYATGNFQVVSGDLRGLSQASVSRIIKNVSVLIAEHLREHIKFPENPNDNIQKFWRFAHFPGVAACIDCSHIPISNPGGDNAEVFRNRKGYFSINVQVAAGPQLEILDIVVRHPGSAHDSLIFDRSALRVRFEQNNVEGFLLGDNGYPCRNYLLTPVIHPDTASEERYNFAHIRTRNVVERLFGVWKRRFPCLRRGITTKLETSIAIICAVATLHNITIAHKEVDFEQVDNANENIPLVNNENNQLGM